jgi:hypothetical protein
LDDRITYAELLEWCEYETIEQERTEKWEFYLARITAQLQAQLNPKGSYYVAEFLLGKAADTGKDLRTMSEDAVLAMWMAAIPDAVWTPAPTETDNG